MKFRLLGVLTCGLLASLAAEVKAEFVVNGGFEAPPLVNSGVPFMTYGVGSTAITGWTVINGINSTGGAGTVDLLGSFAPAHSGAQSLDLDGFAPGGVSQAISGLSAGTTYTLSFFFANNPNSSSASMIASVLGGASVVSESYTHAGSTFTTMNYTMASLTFVAGATTTITFVSSDPAGSASGIVLDDVSIAALAVPEPTSLAMLGLGVAGLGAVSRARRRLSA